MFSYELLYHKRLYQNIKMSHDYRKDIITFQKYLAILIISLKINIMSIIFHQSNTNRHLHFVKVILILKTIYLTTNASEILHVK